MTSVRSGSRTGAIRSTGERPGSRSAWTALATTARAVLGSPGASRSCSRAPSSQTSSTSCSSGILIWASCRQVPIGSLQPSTRKVQSPSAGSVMSACHRSVPGASIRIRATTVLLPPEAGGVATTVAATASWPSRKTVAVTGTVSPTIALAGQRPASTEGRICVMGIRPIIAVEPTQASQPYAAHASFLPSPHAPLRSPRVLLPASAVAGGQRSSRRNPPSARTPARSTSHRFQPLRAGSAEQPAGMPLPTPTRRRDQLAAGATPATLDNGLRSGRVTSVFRGVHVDSGSLGGLARRRAALLTQDPAAVLSHQTAAAAHGLRWLPGAWTRADAEVQITVPVSDKHRQRAGMRLHRTDARAVRNRRHRWRALYVGSAHSDRSRPVVAPSAADRPAS